MVQLVVFVVVVVLFRGQVSCWLEQGVEARGVRVPGWWRVVVVVVRRRAVRVCMLVTWSC